MLHRRLTFADPERIDIGCSQFKKPGYTGIDIDDWGQEIIWDVRDGLPLPDNSVIDIYCSHFLEHLEDKDIRGFYNELYRVCKHDALVEFIVPNRNDPIAYVADHKSFWNDTRFEGFVKSSEPAKFSIVKALSVREKGSGGMQCVAILKVIKTNEEVIVP